MPNFDPEKVQRYRPINCCCGCLATCNAEGICDGVGENYPDDEATVVIATDYEALLEMYRTELKRKIVYFPKGTGHEPPLIP